MYLRISRSVDSTDQVVLNGSYNGLVNITRDPSSIILVTARGGYGGNGGEGGSGGRGGGGGRGGDGGRGGNGRPGRRGEDGGNGGDGGNAGNGGNGADGGHGGDGGSGMDGGNGGNILIDTIHPELLILLECDIKRGKAGRGGYGGSGGGAGSGGSGGSQGYAGSGGSGGTGGDGYESGHRGRDGRNGRSGNSGKSGRPGNSGRCGRTGMDGTDGSIWYVVLDPVTFAPIEQSFHKFNLVVDSYSVRGELDDGIFEPGERVIVENVHVRNNGGLSLPAGALLVFPDTTTFISDKQAYVLPTIRPNETFIVPQLFYGTIPDIPEASYIGRYLSQSTVASHSELVYRTFNAEPVVTTLPVQYPLQISVSGPEHLVQGEKAVFRVIISNISTLPYGTTTGFNIQWRLNIDHRLQSGTGSQVIDGIVEYLDPSTSYVYDFEATVDPNSELFELLPWSADLFFKDKKIEIAQHSVRVTKSYQPMNDTNRDQFDLLFVTNKHIAQLESKLYLRIFDGLGLNVNYWDVEQYNGLSVENSMNQRHAVTWVNEFQGKLIVFPLGHSMQFPLIHPHDILNHFIKDINQPTDLESGLLTIGSVSSAVLPYLLESMIATPIDTKYLSGFFVIGKPTQGVFNKKCNKFLRKKAKKNSIGLYGLSNPVYNLNEVQQKNMLLQLIGSKFELGTASWQQIPITCLSRLYNLNKNDASAFYMAEDRHTGLLEATRFPLDSRFTLVLFSIIRSLSIQAKLKLVYTGGNLAKSQQWAFYGSNDQAYTLSNLLGFALYNDVIQEVLHGIVNGETRMKKIIVEINRKPEYLTVSLFAILCEIQMRIKSVTSAGSIVLFSKIAKSSKQCIKQIESLKSQFIERIGQEECSQTMVQAELNSKNPFPELSTPIERPLLQRHQQYIEKHGNALQEVWKALKLGIHSSSE
jgi:hypothetical protein